MSNATTIPLAAPAFGDIRACNRTWVLRCGTCKSYRRVAAGTLAPMVNRAPFLFCCGNQLGAKVIKGIKTEHVCGSKCTGSKGHVCECSCGGANHGKDA